MHPNENQFLNRQPQSYWLTPSDQQPYPALQEDLKVDTAIVGGGIAGITLAYLMSLEGIKPVMLEADRILFGTTGHTTAKITSQHGLIYAKLITKLGREQAQQYADANESAIRRIESIVQALKIDCDYTPQPAYVYTEREDCIDSIDKEIEAAIGLGIKAEYIERIPFAVNCRGGERFDGQAQFHPRKYLLALADEITREGCPIYEQTRVVDLEKEGGAYSLKTANGPTVRADRVVIASHYPFFNKAGLYFARIHTERSYIVAVRTKEPYPGGMYITAEDPTRSLRSQPSDGGALTLVGGENHKTGQSEDTKAHYRALADFARALFTVEDIPYHWSTQDCMTLDDVPYAGRYGEDWPNLYVATGFGKWGMTNATAASMVIRDLIVRGHSDWEDVYTPMRLNLAASAKNAIVENANVAVNLLEGKLERLPEDVDLQPGEARAVDMDGRRVGAYRDGEGKLHFVDRTCPHMGCEVNWNAAESTWDCPCHGSRFDIDGNVVEGPAVRPLNSGKSVNTLEKLVKDEY